MKKKKELTIEEKSLKAFSRLLKTMPKEELNKIVSEIDAMEFEGPTIGEYFQKFESAYPDWNKMLSDIQKSKTKKKK